MEETMRAYLAGCLDCDGAFSIKRSTYAMRVRGDASQPVFSERVMFAQVKYGITALLREYFGGSSHIDRQRTVNSHLIFRWQVTDKQAVQCVKAVLPYLVVKREQAELLLRLRELKNLPRVKVGTFVLNNRWGRPVVMPLRIVSPEVIQAKEELFNQIRLLNDTRVHQPQLIGRGYSGEEKRR